MTPLRDMETEYEEYDEDEDDDGLCEHSTIPFGCNLCFEDDPDDEDDDDSDADADSTRGADEPEQE